MKKVCCIFGTRPEAIKLCPLILEMRSRVDFDCKVCVTGQHKEMLYQVLDAFKVKPDVDLGLMRPNQSLAELTSRAIATIDSYLRVAQPDMVIVQGDTTTVLAAALAAFYQHIPVAHVEAGLRTWNMQSPWPEEANRVLTTRMSHWHFAPTENNKNNLIKEGVPVSRIFVTGNTVIDALLFARDIVEKTPPAIDGLSEALMKSNERVVLITGHRRENFGHGLEHICAAIKNLAEKFPETHFVYPVHLNPNVREPVGRILAAHCEKNVHLIEPLGYLPFVALMNRASLVLTDSGGVQEEAPSLGKPVLVMRDTTERPEAVAAGTVKIIGTKQSAIEDMTSKLLTDNTEYVKMSSAVNPYGDGDAVTRICDILSV